VEGSAADVIKKKSESDADNSSTVEEKMMIIKQLNVLLNVYVQKERHERCEYVVRVLGL